MKPDSIREYSLSDTSSLLVDLTCGFSHRDNNRMQKTGHPKQSNDEIAVSQDVPEPYFLHGRKIDADCRKTGTNATSLLLPFPSCADL
jgi:hypothetical protein